MIGNDVVDLAHPATRPGAQHPRFAARVFGAAERAALAQSAMPDRLRWIFWAAKEAAYKAARKLDDETIWSPARFEVRLEPAWPWELPALCSTPGPRSQLEEKLDSVECEWRPSPLRATAPQRLRAPGVSAEPAEPQWAREWLGEEQRGDFGISFRSGEGIFGGVVLHGVSAFALRIESNAEKVHALAFGAGDSMSDALYCSGVESCAKGVDASAAVRGAARRQLAGLLGVSPDALRIGRRGRIPTLQFAGLPRGAADLTLSHHGRFVAWACEIERAALRNGAPQRARRTAADRPPARAATTRCAESHAG